MLKLFFYFILVKKANYTNKIAGIIFFILLYLPIIVLAEPVRHNLSNGFTIITSENHEIPVVTFQLWIKAGSAYEVDGEYGITHLIEHMIFKGTSRYPAGQLAYLIETIGGEINAYTSFDHTNYYITIATRYALQALHAFIDSVTSAIFDYNELKKEKEVVLEEMRMNADNLSRRIHEELMFLSYGHNHPYGRPIIGFEESIQSITRQNILDYRAKWYRASNMVLVAVGDFHTIDLLLALEKSLSSFNSQPAPDFYLPFVRLSPGPRIKILREKVSQAFLGLAWLVPGLPSEEVYPLDIAATILGDGCTNRLIIQLKEKRGIIDAIAATNFTPQRYGLFQIDSRLTPEKICRAWPALIAEIFCLVSEPPSAAELKRVRVGITAEFIRNRETIFDQARFLGYFELLRGGFEKVYDYLERYFKLESWQIVKVICRYFKPDNFSLVLQIPEKAKSPTLANLSILINKVFNENILSIPKFSEIIARKITLKNGIILLIKPRKVAPLVSLVLAVPGDQAIEDLRQAGLGQLWARLLIRGTEKHNFQQLNQEQEILGAKILGFSNRNVIGLTASFLAQNWQRSLKLIAEIWCESNFPLDEIIRAKAEQEALLRAQEDSPIIRAFKLFRSLVYSSHPYGQDPLGTLDSLGSLSRDDLLSIKNRVNVAKGLVLSIVGAVDFNEISIEVEQLFSKLHGQIITPQLPPLLPITQPRQETIKDFKIKQTQIVIGFQTPSAIQSSRYVLELVEALLGGQGGRLFHILRDQYSLAYAIQPFYNFFYNSGIFGIYMAVSSEKQDEALRSVSKQLNLLCDFPPSDSELARAKNYLLGRMAINLQNYSAQAMSMAAAEIIGIGFDDYLYTSNRIKSLTGRDLQKIAQQIFIATSQVRLILGP